MFPSPESEIKYDTELITVFDLDSYVGITDCNKVKSIRVQLPLSPQ